MTIEEIRMALHQIPELGFEEYVTKQFILSRTKNLQCKIFEVGKTGLILSFHDNYRKTICFRAEEDALPILEENEVNYKSKNNGKMHACGHDGHMAILIKLAEEISKKLRNIEYNVLLIFQPSEETYGGSKSIIESEIFKKRNIKAFYGMHIWPNLEKGKIYTKKGNLLAKSTEYDISIFNEGGHIAQNKKGNNPYISVMKIIEKINNFNIKDDCILKIGSIETNGSRNIIPSKITIKGSYRTFNSDTENKIEEYLKMMISQIAIDDGRYILLKTNSDYRVVYNNEKLVDKINKGCPLTCLENSFFQAEDFGLYTEKYPCVFFLLGSGENGQLHSSTFNFDMNILTIGLEFYKKLLFLKY